MKIYPVRVHPSSAQLPREEQLAWKIARVAADDVPASREVTEAIIDRVIDDAAVAIAAINRGPVVSAREMALGHTRSAGATIFGVASRQLFSPEWAAWANGTAVRELDMHDTFLAADYLIRATTFRPFLRPLRPWNAGEKMCFAELPPRTKSRSISSKRSACTSTGSTTLRTCAARKRQNPRDARPSGEHDLSGGAAGGHVSLFTTRQSRKGAISSWKAFAPAHSGKLAVEAVDRAMRGEDSPSPIYEGEDSVIAWMLDGPEAQYDVALPGPGEAKRAILESFTKEHSAEYQAQALIDLAFRMRKQIADFSRINKIVIHTSHHTHSVIGTGAADPQKFDPSASRETLDHSIMYIFAVALQDGRWHHVDSYAKQRAGRADTIRLWRGIETRENPEWTRRYHEVDPARKAFGGRVEIFFNDGSRMEDELAVANAHPLGARPFRRTDYIRKFRTLTEGVISPQESERFLDVVQRLPDLPAADLRRLNVELPENKLVKGRPGIF